MSTPTTEARPQVTGITAYLQVRDSRAAAELYQKAFGAETVTMMEMGGKIIHGFVRINGGNLFLSDPFPEHGHPLEKPQAFTLHLQVDDADKWFARAVAAGLEVVMPVGDQFWGDRYGQLRDSFGVLWSIGSTPTK